MSMLAVLYVAMGGAAGSLLRYWISGFVSQQAQGGFPLGTMAVNVLGSFLLGVWIAVAASMPARAREDLHLLVAVGALGGFTTFSTFTLDAFILMMQDRGALMQTTLYVAGSLVVSMLALMLGMWLVRLVAG